MGRHHHSFLYSLKDIGHKVEHTFNSQPQILKSIEIGAAGGPVGIVASLVINNPSISKAIISGVEKAAPSIESALKTVGHEAVATVKAAEHQSAKLRGDIEGMASGALHSVEKFGGGILADLKYIPYVIGGIALIWVYSKVK